MSPSYLSMISLLCGAAWAVVLVGPPFLPFCSGAEINETKETITVNPDGTLEKSHHELSLDDELKSAYEAAKRSLSIYNDAKSRLLSLSAGLIEEGEGKNNEVVSDLEELEKMKEEVVEKSKKIDSTIRDINAQQILDLKEKLSVIKERELQRREKLKEKKEKEKKANRMKIKGVPEDAVKKDELNKLVDLEGIVKEFDADLEEWFIDLVKQETEFLTGEVEKTLIDSTQKISELGEEDTAALLHKEEEDCAGASLTDAVQLVQESLVKYSQDKVGMVDHLAHATVVHYLTSSNYDPPLSPSQVVEFSWWFQYFPEDWEKFLDKVLPIVGLGNWRQWPAQLPDSLFHTLGFTRKARTAPPEAILQPDIYPGSCWPMEGKTGQVTLRLAYPVRVKAITLDHAPKMLLEDSEKRNSAPKQLRVFGYPPCLTKRFVGEGENAKNSDYLDDYLDDSANDNIEIIRGTCEDGLDFDVTKPTLLLDFEYELDGPTIQTFRLSSEEDEDEASCSETTGMCGSESMLRQSDDSEVGVVAIGLEILDNWGNKDYTCVYRFRIHGDAIDEEEENEVE